MGLTCNFLIDFTAVTSVIMLKCLIKAHPQIKGLASKGNVLLCRWSSEIEYLTPHVVSRLFSYFF